MNRKEKILNYIMSKEYQPVPTEILKAILGVPDDDSDEFYSLLNELKEENKIYLSKKKCWHSVEKDGLIVGVLNCTQNGRFGFVRIENDDKKEVFIPHDALLDAYSNDTVICVRDNINKRTGNFEGHIKKVVKRGNERLTGVVEKIRKDKIYITPDSKKIYATIIVKNNVLVDVRPKDRVLVEITGYPERGIIFGIITKNLGNSDEIKSNIQAIIEEHSIKEEFFSSTITEAKNTPKRVTKKEIEERTDLRDELIFTIDGDDAKDFDDAVSLKVTDDGNFLLGVHIADVTHYVTEGSMLDSEAFLRGTSVYFPGRVIPMLPFELSNGICSLKPDVNRLCLSVFIKIDEEGNTQFEKLEKTVIRSKERMTYNDVALLLENPTKKLLDKYEYLLPTLELMKKVSKILYKRRMMRGSIDFDFPEAHIIVDNNGEPTDIIKTQRKISHKIIEEFMLLANETIAQLAFWAEIPFIFRIHEPPTLEKTENFNSFIKNFGYSIKGKFDNDNPVHPKAFAQILDKIRGSDEETMISSYMLRSLMKAEYKSENLGHFGLSAKYYCHFTSPIRRYPDLMIHRILKAYIEGRETDNFYNKVLKAAKNSSDTEREAEYCERDVEDLLMAAFMREHIGEDYEGIVSSVTNFGMFVRLENTVEGLIRLDTMKDDYYEFDEATRTIKGKRKNRSYKIGDKVNIITVNCDLLTRSIDFIRIEDALEFDRLNRIKKKRKTTNNYSHSKTKSYKRKRRGKKHGKI